MVRAEDAEGVHHRDKNSENSEKVWFFGARKRPFLLSCLASAVVGLTFASPLLPRETAPASSR